jgi:uncharacterized delta-60 repeat protein
MFVPALNNHFCSNQFMKAIYTLLLITLLSPHVIVMAQHAGDPDPAFGTLGTMVTDFGTGNTRAVGMVLQADQKAVIGGFLSGLPCLTRLNTDGSVDETFGDNGLALGDVSTGLWPNPTSLLGMLDDGKFIIVYYTGPTLLHDIALTRFNNDGSIDMSFGVNGTSIQSCIDGDDTPDGMIIQDDGKIVVVGSGYETGSNVSQSIIARFTADGLLDNSFAGDGVFTFSYGTSGVYASDVVQQPDGRLVVVNNAAFFGSTAYDIVLLRLNVDGTLDNSFGDNGMAHLILSNDSDYGIAVTLKPDGKIVIGGVIVVIGDIEMLLLQVNPDGTLDTNFGENAGYTIPHLGDDADRAESILIASDGKIVVAGSHDDFMAMEQ